MIEIPAHEKDMVRVFAVSGGAEVDALRQTFLTGLDADAEKPDPAAFHALLGNADLNTDYIEIFPVNDIAELRLSGYLTQALDVRSEAIAPDRARLDALQGNVLLLLSSAFEGRPSRLDPNSALTLIGTYPTESFVPSQPGALPDPGGTAMPSPRTTPDTRSRRLGSGSIALIVVAAIALAAALLLLLPGGTP